VPQAGAGRFELRIGDAAVQTGAVAEGQVLESGAHGRIDVDLPTARLHLMRGTRVRFDRAFGPELTVSLLKGRLEVDFHPARKGEQHMAVESAAARVQVVGTRFALDVDAIGNTDVSVSEGVVEVLPRSGGPTRRLVAGERTHVRADEGDESERKVRDAIEAKLRSLDAAVPDSADPEAEFRADMDFSMERELLEPSAAAPKPSRAVARKLEAARRLLRQGRHAAARGRLRGVAESGVPVRFRVEALTLIAESYTSQGDVPRAAAAYRRADEISPADASGHNARFALARLLERQARDERAAADAYRRYLERAPRGALAAQARQGLCRLGERDFCK
jgi:tetratricopeptide (TPR) repeat protein